MKPTTRKRARRSTLGDEWVVPGDESETEHENKANSDEDWEAPTEKVDKSDEDPEYSDDEAAEVANRAWTNRVSLRSIPFDGVNGLKVPKPNECRPIDYFLMMADDTMLGSIADCVNANGTKMASEATPKTRISRWKNITIDDLKVFIGLLLHTGTIRTHRLQDYWRRSKLFGIPCFPDFMSRDRFLAIMRCLSFTNNPELKTPLDKIRGLVDYFNNKMDSLYAPRKDLAITDRLVLWKGRIYPQRQFEGKSLDNKMRLYSLTECRGLILRLMVCLGDPAGDRMDDVVMVLMQGRLSKGHALYLDPDYLSVSLASKLLALNTYCTGLLPHDHRHLPAEVLAFDRKENTTIARYSEGVMAGKWMGKCYVSTEFDNTMVSLVNNKGKDRSKPSAVYHFIHQRRFFGLDRTEQMMDYYSADGNTLERTRKVFVHLLQVIMMNAFILYCEFEKKMPFYDFRLAVIEPLVDCRSVELEHVPVRPVGGRYRCHRCVNWTTYLCQGCPGVTGLCLTCFRDYHLDQPPQTHDQ